MRFVFGQGWVHLFDSTDGEDGNGTTGGAAAGGEGSVEGDGDGTGDGAGEDLDGDGAGDGKGVPAADGKKGEAPKDMKEALDAGLGYKKGPNGEELDPLTGKPKEQKPVEKKPAASDGKESETHWANGKPKKNEKGQSLDDKGQFIKAPAAKPKTSAELALKPEELKALGAKTQQRFGEMITTLKAHEGTIAKQAEQITGLSEARDAIIGVLTETNTSQDQLVQLLEYNRLSQSSNPQELEAALQVIEGQRVALYKALGREPAEGGGIDLLADFPDLKKQVEEEEITRAAALELAKARRTEAARTAAAQRAGNAQQQQRAQKEKFAKDSEAALTAIDEWVAEISSDLDYKAKEDKLLGQIDGVIKEYAPHQWVPTLKRLYAGIEIPKAPAAAGGNKTPLRPSGARPGAKAPTDMLEAINTGLGYAKG